MSEQVGPNQTIRDSGLVNALVRGGIGLRLARIIRTVFENDEKTQRLARQNKRPIIYNTQQDSKVDDKICLPLEGEVFDRDDPKRIKIPDDTHPNCRCFYIDGITGDNLGQI